jgi:ureidoacrylate peracid hydrolase
MNIAVSPSESPLLVSVEQRLRPAHTALLVIDMQNDFCAPGGYIETVVGKDASACRAVVAPITRLAAAARSAGVPVFWVCADYTLAKLPASMAARFAAQGEGRVCCAPGTFGADFYGVRPVAGEPVVVKSCFSAFIGTDLEAQLRARAVRTIVFAGVQTNICVESTLRAALSLGFHVVVAEDCVASHTPHLHAATLDNVRFVLGDALAGERIAAFWRGSV